MATRSPIPEVFSADRKHPALPKATPWRADYWPPQRIIMNRTNRLLTTLASTNEEKIEEVEKEDDSGNANR
jgi:hypothetical protein